LVPGGGAGTTSTGHWPTPGQREGGSTIVATGLPSLLQAFFTDRLLRQQRASPNTVAGYRDSFRLLFRFAKERLGKAPSNLMIEDLSVSFIGDFLDHLENHRKNSVRTRNIRLAAIHSFFQYVTFEEPAHALLCQRILAMPSKRHERRPIEFLNRDEIDALLGSADLSTWIGRRDRTLLLLTVQTGLRVSELISLTCQDVVLGTGAHVHCQGKGRKHRCTPLRPETAKMLRTWMRECLERHSPEGFRRARGRRSPSARCGGDCGYRWYCPRCRDGRCCYDRCSASARAGQLPISPFELSLAADASRAWETGNR